jgi:Leucine-rich repeat (LRR) protein
MVRATRKQKGSGWFYSTPVYANVEVDYSGKGLSTEALGELLLSKFPSQREMDRVFTLNVSNNNLKEMPDLPIQNLNSLDCSHNKLTAISTVVENPLFRSLSDLYPYLQSLYCDNNNLTSLPRLTPSLDTLECDHNLLTVLPKLPEGLKVLKCNNNKLKVLPELPQNLEEIVCEGNPFVAPFNNFVADFIKTKNIADLKNKVNNHLAKDKRTGGRRKTRSKKYTSKY